jgi:hypothetical protein
VIDLAKGRTEMPAAVARLAQLVPPARVDLVDEVLVGVGRRDLSITLDWPPAHLVHQFAHRVKSVHLWTGAHAGPNGEVVDVIRYRDKMQQDRRAQGLAEGGMAPQGEARRKAAGASRRRRPYGDARRAML